MCIMRRSSVLPWLGFGDFFKLNLLKLEDIYKLKIAELVRLQYNVQTNIYITNMSGNNSFKMPSNAHKYNIRQTFSFYFLLLRVRTKLGKCSHEFA